MQPDDLDFNPVGRRPLGDFDPWARTVYLPGVEKRCENCGATYRATPNNAERQRTCSGACRMALWRKRQAGETDVPAQSVAVPMWKFRRNFRHQEDECSDITASAS